MTEEIETCGICLDELEILQDNIYKTICGHSFHENCIHKSMKKNNCCPYCRKELQTPSAVCIYKIINSIMIKSDYACMLETGVYAEIEDEDCYFTETDDTLYFIMYIFNNEWNCINHIRLLLSLFTYHNNIRFYPKKILKDYRQIAEEYYRWIDFGEDNYELDLITNKIESYSGSNKRKSNSVLLMNKTIEWGVLEKQYEKELIQNYNNGMGRS